MIQDKIVGFKVPKGQFSSDEDSDDLRKSEIASMISLKPGKKNQGKISNF